ncbi:MAG TPA: hypothetical protein VJ201_01745 [Candidatus Babeliales bacterium]|nr:hypothetical protein [Candidatus Babeliales bacterium]
MNVKYIATLILGFGVASVLYPGPSPMPDTIQAQLVVLTRSGSGQLKLMGFEARELEDRRQAAAAQASADAHRMNQLVLDLDQVRNLEQYWQYQKKASDNRRIKEEYYCPRGTLNCCTFCLISLGSYLVILMMSHVVTALKKNRNF